MRYLLHKSQAHELEARQEYLFDIFHLYFLPGKPEGSYIPLIPVGTKGLDVLFITGHTTYVHFSVSFHILIFRILIFADLWYCPLM